MLTMKAQILMILMLLMLLLLMMMMMLLFYHARPGKTVWARPAAKSRALLCSSTLQRNASWVGGM
jgi:hypothetical protein